MNDAPMTNRPPPEKRLWKNCGVALLTVGVLLTTGFFAGRGYQHLKSGHYFSIRDKKSYPFGPGEIRWQYVTDTIGLPFMDSGKTIIEYHSLSGHETTLYKSGVVFQEGTPFAANIAIDGHTLRWDDGKFRYTLEMETMPPENPPAEPAVKNAKPAH